MGLAFLHERNWRGVQAQDVYEKSVDLLPNDATLLQNYARFKAWTDQPEEAISLARQAVRLAPKDASSFRILGIVHELFGNPAEAADAFRTARSMSPAGTTNAQRNVALMEVVLGNAVEAETELRLFEPIALNSPNGTFLANVAYGYARLGLNEDAARVLAEIEERAVDRTVALGARVLVSLARAEEEQALYWLGRVAEEREIYLGQALVMRLKANAFADPTLDKSDFVAIRERLGFTDL